MTRNIQDETEDGLTRRGMLRQTAFVAGAATVGVGALSAPVAASSCPRTPGYWMNHDWPSTGLENVNERMLGITGTEDYFASVSDGQAFLRSPARGDKGHIMATHIVAFILNNQLACEEDVIKEVTNLTDHADYPGDESVLDIKALAQNWLRESSFPNAQRTWYVGTAIVEDGEVLKDLLDEYNNGTLIECTCDGPATTERTDKSGPPAHAASR
jgi:hypothetical protein